MSIVSLIQLSREQLSGAEPTRTDLYLDALCVLPPVFNPTGVHSLHLDGLTELPENFRVEVACNLYLNGLTKLPKGFAPRVGCNLYLNGLTEIPRGFIFPGSCSVYLNGITELPRGFSTTFSDSVYLDGLTKLPVNFRPVVPGSLGLNEVTRIAKGFEPVVGGSLGLNRVTKLPDGFNITVGRDLGLNRVTKLPKGFAPVVGGDLLLRHLEELPRGPGIRGGGAVCTADYARAAMAPIRGPMFWRDRKYIKVDGIFAEVLKHTGNVYRVKLYGRSKSSYLVTSSKGAWAHGDTLREARADLVYKIGERNSAEFAGMAITAVLPFADAVACYRSITGACSSGVRRFVEGTRIAKGPVTIKELIRLTEGCYGHQTFKEFFAPGNPARPCYAN